MPELITSYGLILNTNTNSEMLAAQAGEHRWEGTRDGAAFVASYWHKKALQGRLWVANFGTVTTPLTFLVTADKRPDAVLRVPSGTTIPCSSKEDWIVPGPPS